jgi:pimeloyl-ACP methyl ester carboxylesterase
MVFQVLGGIKTNHYKIEKKSEMVKNKISFTHKNGKVEGVYINAGALSSLVIIINGHNGFYNYGMFPYLQQKFFDNGISTFSFNFSHGGIIGDGDFFDDLGGYEKNCMRLEVEDLISVLHNLSQFGKHGKIILLAHSLGGVPAIFGAVKAEDESIKIDGIILVSTLKTLNFWPKEMISEWATAGVFYKKNNRTKQELPQGFEFLQEVINADSDWNVEEKIKHLKSPVLIVHGENDEAIPVEHAQSLYKCIKDLNPKASLKIIANATHTFNTKHPFENVSDEVNELIETCTHWIKALTVS